MIRLTAMLGAALLFAGAAIAEALALDKAPGDVPGATVRQDISLEARPGPGAPARWSRERQTLVVNLLTQAEITALGDDYPVEVMSQGLAYAHIPVSRMTGPEAADALAALLAETEGPAVIHCASSARAAHLFAASQIRSGALTRDQLDRIDPDRAWDMDLLDRLSGETPAGESGQ
ncbi:hypothetical protein F1654_08175 [Alkalicaulis satelles]|uniref:Phosphatase n=1 Tax=Alkalicaulis satelles TaxID=2609175 RepID=A0A5M6ZIA2_9PROT|nr:sulfur transferase domain-containing protein [Alkalicaulis satelles]KAA5803765.1 hypothetical protein F1654_08175 [Alkalicaulis satelles]